MQLRDRSVRVGSSVVAALALVSLFSPNAAPRAVGTLEVVADGLDNPRGMTFGPLGVLYVAEAGRGGDGVCIPAPGTNPPATRCYGPSGAVTAIWPRTGWGYGRHGDGHGEIAKGRCAQGRVVKGLPSLALADGSEATGASDISIGLGGAYVVVGLGGHPVETREALGPVGRRFGRIVHVPGALWWHRSWDVAAHELSNPDGTAVDSNPYSLEALASRFVVTDAGGNSLVEVKRNGETSTLSVFPSQLVPAPPFLGLPPGAQVPSQAVPTSVVRGPDGDFYVGQLTGFPFPVGGASVWHVPSHGGSPASIATGFTNIIDLAFGPDHSLYVLEFAKDGLLAGPPMGRLTRIAPDGVRTVLVDEGLVAPGGLAISRRGAIFISNYGATPAGTGQVVKVVVP